MVSALSKESAASVESNRAKEVFVVSAASVVSAVSEAMVVTAHMVVFTVSEVSAVMAMVMVTDASAMLVLSLLAVVKAAASTLAVLAMVDTAMDTAKEDVSIMVDIRVTIRALEDMVKDMVVSVNHSVVAAVLTDQEVTTRDIELLTSPAATATPSAPRALTPKSKLLFPMVTISMLMVVQLATVTSDMQPMANPTATTTLTDAHTGEYTILTSATTTIETRLNMKVVSMQHIAELFPVK